MGEAGRIRSQYENSPCFFLRCTLPFGGVRIVGPIILAQLNKRIGKVQTLLRRTSPIVTEIAY
jgi:hypothetical protein